MEIEIPSTASIASLGASVLATFGLDDRFPWYITFRDDRFVLDLDKHTYALFENPPARAVSAYSRQLYELGLRVRSRMEMTYEMHDPWLIGLRITASRAADWSADGNAYPRLVAGKGSQLPDVLPLFSPRDVQKPSAGGEVPIDGRDLSEHLSDSEGSHTGPQFCLNEAAADFRKRWIALNNALLGWPVR